MADPAFDPTAAVTFDLGSGCIRLCDDAPHVLTPVAELQQLLHAAGPELTREFALAIGACIARRITTQLDGEHVSADTIGLDAFVRHVQQQFAMVGLGTFAIETWGQALVLVVEHHGISCSFIGSVLEAVLRSLFAKRASCVVIEKKKTITRFVVASGTAVTKLEQWIHEKLSWQEIIARLHMTGYQQDHTP